MSLPIILSQNKDLSQMQTLWAAQINPVINSALSLGQVIQNQTLSSGTNEVPHKLGRKLQGWFLVRQRGSASVYDLQDNEAMPTLFLKLHSSATVSVDIYVF